MPDLSASMFVIDPVHGKVANYVPAMTNPVEVAFRVELHDIVSPSLISSSWPTGLVDNHLIIDSKPLFHIDGSKYSNSCT